MLPLGEGAGGGINNPELHPDNSMEEKRMTQVHNSEVLQELRDAAKLQLGKDKIPDFLSSGIMPTIELNPKIVKIAQIRSNQSTISGTLAVYTTSSTKDTYLIGASLSVAKDAACDTATGRYALQTTINGRTIDIVSVAFVTLQALDGQQTALFPHPVKIDRGAAINITGTFAAGILSRSAQVYFYEDETTYG